MQRNYPNFEKKHSETLLGQNFIGYHPEWNLGSPGGWDYQKTCQIIGKTIWQELCKLRPELLEFNLDLDDKRFFPIHGFAKILKKAHESKDGEVFVMMAEEDTFDVVVENRNLVTTLNQLGVPTVQAGPKDLELDKAGRVTHKNIPVSMIFADFNNDIVASAVDKTELDAGFEGELTEPLLRAIKEKRVINPRHLGPVNVKSIFEFIYEPKNAEYFNQTTVERTLWTKIFDDSECEGPNGEKIKNLMDWTQKNWDKVGLVLKPEDGHSGIGVYLSGIHSADEAIEAARLSISQGKGYIVQKRFDFGWFSEMIPEVSSEGKFELIEYATDMRSFLGSEGIFGFLTRFGKVPVNIGRGGGMMPLAILPENSRLTPGQATQKINQIIMSIGSKEAARITRLSGIMAEGLGAVYKLGPIKISMRPRILTRAQMEKLDEYAAGAYRDCITLAKIWKAGALDETVRTVNPEIKKIAEIEGGWDGRWGILATDGMFGFGSWPEE